MTGLREGGAHAIAPSGAAPGLTRREIDESCRSLPGVTATEWHPDVLQDWRVGNRMFAHHDWAHPDGERVSVKCADAASAAALIEGGIARTPRYLNRALWGSLPFVDTSRDVAEELITASYFIVRGELHQAVRRSLPPWEAG